MFSGIKSWLSDYTFKYPWDLVVYAASYKYPNIFNPHVKHIDIISRHIDEKTGIMFTHKLMTTEWPMFNNLGRLYASEYTAIDPKNRRMILVSVNHSLSTFLTAKEKLEYTEDSKSDKFTLMNQKTTVKGFTGFLDRIINLYATNALQGREAIEWVIENRIPTMPQIPERQKLSLTPLSMASTSSSPNQLDNEFENFLTQVETCWNDISRDVNKAKEEIVNRGVLLARMFTNVLFDDLTFFNM